jgi:hypothetical protein
MTMDDYTAALSETNDIGILISQIALKHEYITTETISLLLSEEKLSEPIRSFLIQNRYVYGKPHHIVNLNNNKYISNNTILRSNWFSAAQCFKTWQAHVGAAGSPKNLLNYGVLCRCC